MLRAQGVGRKELAATLWHVFTPVNVKTER